MCSKPGQAQQALDRVNTTSPERPKDAVGRFIHPPRAGRNSKTNDAIMTFQSLTEDYPNCQSHTTIWRCSIARRASSKARVALAARHSDPPQLLDSA